MSNVTKQQWNATHYSQLKISINPELAAAFKAFCKASGSSMAGELSAFMQKCIGMRAANTELPSVESRKQRRKEVASLLSRLNRVLDAEQSCLDNTPDNLVGSAPYEATEGIIEALIECIDNLEAAYE